MSLSPSLCSSFSVGKMREDEASKNNRYVRLRIPYAGPECGVKRIPDKQVFNRMLEKSF